MEASRKDHRTFFSMMHPPDPQTVKYQQKERIETITVPYHRIEEELSLYEWRRMHSGLFVSYNWLRLEPFNQKEVTFYLISIQKVTNLREIKIVKGSRIIKGISKIFQAFDNLYYKFGPFELSQQMIAFDVFYDPFVWFNSQHIKNEYKRDHISEIDFASNILFLLLKNDHKFQNQRILECCCELKGQGLRLKQLSLHFKDFYERQIKQKNSKLSLKSTSKESTLSFNRKSKIKRTNRCQKQNMKVNLQNGEIYRSFLNNNQKNCKKLLQKSSSLKDFKFEAIQSDNQSQYAESQMKTNTQKQSNLDKEQQYKQELFLPIYEQLQVSIDFSNDSQLYIAKQVIQLQKLDRFNRFLVTSINMDDRQ